MYGLLFKIVEQNNVFKVYYDLQCVRLITDSDYFHIFIASQLLAVIYIGIYN